MILFNPQWHTFYSTKISDEQFLSGFGTRQSGNATVQEERENFFKNNLIQFQKVVLPRQKHTTNIAFHDAVNEEAIDGVVTNKSEMVLMIRTADCVPIIFVDKKSGVVGVSHQGWLGTLNKMTQKMAEKMIESGAHKATIIVAIGPAINACCYQIYGERLEQFKRQFPKYLSEVLLEKESKTFICLAKLNYLQLLEIGLNKEQIDFFPFCTYCDDAHFYSYRREGTLKGEQFSFIMKK